MAAHRPAHDDQDTKLTDTPRDTRETQTEPASDPGRAAPYIDRFWESDDGLQLHYRDYEGPEGSHALPALCIPGLTRNARDFESLAETLAQDRRVLVAELRGRGLSEQPRDAASYTPVTYAQDIAGLFAQEGIARAVFIGTSLGGIVTMLHALSQPEQVAGAVLNDIGPEIEQAGLDRIAGYVGQGRNYPTWMHAARALQESQGDCYPDWGLDEWLAHAKRLMVMGNNGRIGFDYDSRIADAFARDDDRSEDDAPAPVSLWPGFDALSGRPVLVLRGENSDLLSPATAAKMAERWPEVALVTVPRTGHAPTLDEPQSREAIAALLQRTG